MEGFDDILETGSPGIFTSSDPAEGSVDATFDNFTTSPDGAVDASELAITRAELSGDTLVVQFSPVQANAGHSLDLSSDLITWSEVEDDFDVDDGTGIFEISADSGAYYRVRRNN